jgi:hypothetical protein
MFTNGYTRTILRIKKDKLEKAVREFNVVSPSFLKNDEVKSQDKAKKR